MLTKKMYVTRYALSSGIFVGEAYVETESNSGLRRFVEDTTYYRDTVCFDTEEEALVQVEKMLSAKRKSLKKSLDKLENFKPKLRPI